MTTSRFKALAAVAVAGLTLAPTLAPAHASTSDTHTLFVLSARENADYTQVTLPLLRGVSGGQSVYYVVLDTSNINAAKFPLVNYAPKIANARGTAAVQQVTIDRQGVVHFPATVDFSPQRVVVAGPTGFPPSQAQPGAVSQPGYSPLVELPDGTVFDAPQIANANGQADKIVSIDYARHTVTYRETRGFYDHRNVHYASFESSDRTAAALEDVTYAPALDAAPSVGDESDSTSSREGLIAFTNGQTLHEGLTQPYERQGLSSAIWDGLDPLNILHEVPRDQNDPKAYSPLWDVRLATWAVPYAQRQRQTGFDEVLALAQQGTVTGVPAGTPFGPSGFIVTCPLISMDGIDSATQNPPL